jgi:cell wall-associated NlpC family hydrolase
MLRPLALLALAGLTAAGCASIGAVPQPFPRSGADAGAATATPPDSATAAEGYSISGTALALRGVPYRNGGSDPAGFDCSGLVWYVFARHGLTIPRTVAEQFRAGAPAGGGLLPGDLVFFSTVAPGASHVGIAIGGDEFVHAPSSSGEVRVERLSAGYWATRYVGARRIL